MSSEPDLRRAIALDAPDGKNRNTIVLGGATVVVPLEMDPAGDPLHDDEVRLWSARGSFDRTLLVSDEDVEPDADNRLMLYRFRDVPFGVYRVAVCVAGIWHDLMHGLVVTKDGVFLGGKKLSTEKPTLAAAPFEAPDADDRDDGGAEGDPLDPGRGMVVQHPSPPDEMELGNDDG